MAANIGTAIFGIFCLVVVVFGAIFVASVSNQQTTYTDTYGNTFNNATNTSQNVTTMENLTPGYGIAILLSVVMLLLMVIGGFYAYSKIFMS